MDEMPRKKMRREDLSFYIDSNTTKIEFAHEKVFEYLAKGVAFVKRLFICERQANYAKIARPATFYNRVQPYRPVPRRPFPPGTYEEMERVRKGFDPIHMTVSRYEKEEKERLRARQEALEEAKQRRERENEEAAKQAQPRKIFKRVVIFEEDEESKKARWDLIDKQYQLALDNMKELGAEAQKRASEGSFFAAKNKKQEKPSQAIKQPVQAPQTPAQSNTLPTVHEDSYENTSDSSTYQAERIEPMKTSQVDNSQNPFIHSINKTVTLKDLIQDSNVGQSNQSLFPQSASRAEISSMFSFNSQQNHQNSNFNQSNFPPFQQAANPNPNPPFQFNNPVQPSPPSFSNQVPSFLDQTQSTPNYSTSSLFSQRPPQPPSQKQFLNAISNPSLSNANPSEYFSARNNNQSRLFQTSSNRTTKREKVGGYRHAKKSQLRVQ